MAKGTQVTTKTGTKNTITNKYGIVSNTSPSGNLTIKNSIPTVMKTSVVEGATKIEFSGTASPKTEPLKHLTGPVIRQNSNNYPTTDFTKRSNDDYKYDYTLSVQKDIIDAIQKEKENLNIPSAYSRREVISYEI